MTYQEGPIALRNSLLEVLSIRVGVLPILHLELMDLSFVVTKTSWAKRLIGRRIYDLSWSQPLSLRLIIGFDNRAIAD